MTHEVECPRCHRMERANVEEDRLVACSLCTMRMALKLEKDGITSVWKHPGEHTQAQERKPAFRLKTKKEVKVFICGQCGEEFTPRSKYQQYCTTCHEGRKGGGNTSVKE